MHAMQNLRAARVLAQLVLAWFVLFVGMAAASPLLKPGPTELICSGSGILKAIPGNTAVGDQAQPVSQHTLDCLMCFSLDAPPTLVSLPVAPRLPLGRLLQSIPAARIAALTAAPLPARGPPTSA